MTTNATPQPKNDAPAYTTWTCDNLLPCYGGHSLPAVFAREANVGGKRKIAIDGFVGYDASGKAWTVARPLPKPR